MAALLGVLELSPRVEVLPLASIRVGILVKTARPFAARSGFVT